MLWVDYIRMVNGYTKKVKEKWVQTSYIAYHMTDGKIPFNRFISWITGNEGDMSVKELLQDKEFLNELKNDIKELNKDGSI